MKKIIIAFLAFSLIMCFAGCSSRNEPATTEAQTKQTTTKIVTTAPSEANTTSEKASETTTRTQEDTSFIYSGYWYRAETNKVIVIKFMNSGKAQIIAYKNRELKGGSIAQETRYNAKFSLEGNVLKLVNTDLAVSQDEYELYTLKNSALTYIKEDPEGASEFQMINNSELSPQFARTLIDDAG